MIKYFALTAASFFASTIPAMAATKAPLFHETFQGLILLLINTAALGYSLSSLYLIQEMFLTKSLRVHLKQLSITLLVSAVFSALCFSQYSSVSIEASILPKLSAFILVLAFTFNVMTMISSAIPLFFLVLNPDSNEKNIF